jgi:hypothetical protein
MTPPQPTPPPVLAAIDLIAKHAREREYGCVIISPQGGASFQWRMVLDEKMELFGHIERLIKERNRLDRQRGVARRFIRKIDSFAAWSKPAWYESERDKAIGKKVRR